MYKVVIIDDDPLSQQSLLDLVEKELNQFQIEGVFSNVADGIAALKDLDIDLVFLDMELPDGQGFDVLKSLEEIHFEVIITTMHNSFMLEAIKHSAIDYLMKPVEKAGLLGAVSNFEKRIAKFKKVNTRINHKENRSNRLVIPNQQGLLLVEIDDIVRLESEGAYTKLFTVDKTVHLTSRNLGYYEQQLNQYDFFRAHHKHLINLAHIKNYIRGEGGQVVMSDNSTVDVSRRKKDDFMKVLGL